MLWISEWPRSLVYPTFLSPVLLSTGVQRSMSLICTPMRTDQAARDIRKKKTEYVSDAAQRARIGQIEDASQRAEYQDVLQQEADLTAGHGVLRYTGQLSVSAPTVAELDAAVAAIEQAETARTTLRLLAEATRSTKPGRSASTVTLSPAKPPPPTRTQPSRGRTVTLQEGRTAATTMRLLDEHELFDTTSRMTT